MKDNMNTMKYNTVKSVDISDIEISNSKSQELKQQRILQEKIEIDREFIEHYNLFIDDLLKKHSILRNTTNK